MTAAITVLFLAGPVVAVPVWLRLAPTPEAPLAGRLIAWARRLSLPSGVALAVAFSLPTGPVAAILAIPWLATAGLCAFAAAAEVVEAFRGRQPLSLGSRDATWAAFVFLAIAAVNALADRLGVQPFGFPPVIVLLTAVHFTFAGFVLVLVGVAAAERRPGRWVDIAIGAVIVGIPMTAVGFFGVALAAWIGALLVATGGAGIGLATVLASGEFHPSPSRWLARVAGLSLLASMPLAAAYATGVWFGTAWLDLPTMARTHGALNVLGFSLPVTIAWALDRRAANQPGAIDLGPSVWISADALWTVLGIAFGLGAYAVVVTTTWLPYPIWAAVLIGCLLVISLSMARLIRRIFLNSGPR